MQKRRTAPHGYLARQKVVKKEGVEASRGSRVDMGSC